MPSSEYSSSSDSKIGKGRTIGSFNNNSNNNNNNSVSHNPYGGSPFSYGNYYPSSYTPNYKSATSPVGGGRGAHLSYGGNNNNNNNNNNSVCPPPPFSNNWNDNSSDNNSNSSQTYPTSRQGSNSGVSVNYTNNNNNNNNSSSLFYSFSSMAVDPPPSSLSMSAVNFLQGQHLTHRHHQQHRRATPTSPLTTTNNNNSNNNHNSNTNHVNNKAPSFSPPSRYAGAPFLRGPRPLPLPYPSVFGIPSVCVSPVEADSGQGQEDCTTLYVPHLPPYILNGRQLKPFVPHTGLLAVRVKYISGRDCDVAFLVYEQHWCGKAALEWMQTARRLKRQIMKKNIKEETATSSSSGGGGGSMREVPVLEGEKSTAPPLLPYTTHPLTSPLYASLLLRCVPLQAYPARQAEGRPSSSREDWVAEGYHCGEREEDDVEEEGGGGGITHRQQPPPPVPVDLFLSPTIPLSSTTTTTITGGASTLLDAEVPPSLSPPPPAVKRAVPAVLRKKEEETASSGAPSLLTFDPHALDKRLPVRTLYFKLKVNFSQFMPTAEWTPSPVEEGTISGETDGGDSTDDKGEKEEGYSTDDDGSKDGDGQEEEEVPLSEEKEGTAATPASCCVRRDWRGTAAAQRMICIAAHHHHHHHLFAKSYPSVLPGQAGHHPPSYPATATTARPSPAVGVSPSSSSPAPPASLAKEFEFTKTILSPSFFEERFPGVECYRPYLNPPYTGGCFVKFVCPQDALHCLRWARQQPELLHIFSVQMARKDLEMGE